MEGFVADDALVGLLDAVRQLVVLVVALLVEALAAELADERFEAGVNADVRVERRRAVEGLAAGGALVRLVRRVDDLVPAQRRRLPESFSAHLISHSNSTQMHSYFNTLIIYYFFIFFSYLKDRSRGYIYIHNFYSNSFFDYFFI